jgi:hypothetical protein
MPGTIEPELYLRWIQFGIFSPILRTHTTKNPDSERRIWAYPQPYSDLMRDAFVLRYALQPYIYTEARRTYDTGVAFLHPLYYDSPEAPEAYDAKDEYMFGDNVLVAPISQPTGKDSQLVNRSVWLPEGDWIEWDTGARLKGPASAERTFSIRQIPVYVKAGSIIPMQPQMRYTGEKPVDPLILTVFPPADGQASSYRLYEDAGNTTGYKRNEAAWTNIHASVAANGTALTLTISPVEGRYNGMRASRAYEVRLRGTWPPASVTVNGAIASHTEAAPGWSYDATTLTTIVRTRSVGTASPVTISVKIKPSLAPQRALLEGFAGKMTRLREAYDILNATWPNGWSPDELIDAMQTADRIGYHPQEAFAELSALQEKLAALPQQIQAMHATEDSPEFKAAIAANLFGQPQKPEEDIVTRYHNSVDLGLAHLADILPPR